MLFRILILLSPRKDRAFKELRIYYIRPSWYSWGPKNVHFGKKDFRYLNINLKMAKKLVQSWKNAEKLPNRNPHFLDISYKDKCSGNCVKYTSCILWWLEDGNLKKMVSVHKKLFFNEKFRPSKFHFCLKKRLKTAKRVSLGGKN